MTHEIFMQRCLELARMGLGHTSPNPMVGSVIVCNKKIIGEGFHQKFGEAHAEVNAINSVKNKALLKQSTLYVNLEPCSHQGKTPPCSSLILEHKIPKVVVGCLDPFYLVAGKGVIALQNGGCKTVVGILENESIELNRRFITYHQKKRPYIILKWAQTLDDYIDKTRNENSPIEPNWITNEISKNLVHKWRAEEDAIMVGANTVRNDNPKLNVRNWTGKNPLRILVSRKLNFDTNFNIFDKSIPTIVFTDLKTQIARNFKSLEPFIEFIRIDYRENSLNQIVNVLYNKGIQSVIIEGGAKLLNSFIQANLWDEARQLIGNKFYYNGIKAPKITGNLIFQEQLEDSRLSVFKNFTNNL